MLLGCVGAWCLNISTLKLSPSCLETYNLDWLSAITNFRNLEKLEIDIYIPGVNPWSNEEFDSFINMHNKFQDNPMPKLKELQSSHVNIFCQDIFLVHLFDYFPNLETFTVKNEVKGSLPHWRLPFMVNVLKTLASLKNLTLPNMDMYLEDGYGMYGY